MPQITAFTPTKRDPQRVSIRVDGKVVATMNRKLLDNLGLAVGDTWDDALATRVTEEAAYDKALRAAMNRLNRRMLSRRDLSRKLRDKEHESHIIERVCDRLEELEVLDDRAYGKALMRQAKSGKPAGPMLLRSKLMQKGLERNIIDELINEDAGSQEEQIEGALKLIRQKERSMARLEAHVRNRRLWSMLARRGYSTDVIREAMEQVDQPDSEY